MNPAADTDPGPQPEGSGVDLRGLSRAQLLALYGEVLARLYEIGAVRNFNSPTGDIAEQLVAEYYGGTVAVNNQKSYDVVVGDHRLQVKARRVEAGVHRAAFSPHRTYDFEALVAVVFEPDMRVREAFYVPANVLRDVEGWSTTHNAGRFSITQSVRADSRITHIDGQALMTPGAGRIPTT
jgi:hypothetical protein